MITILDYGYPFTLRSWLLAVLLLPGLPAECLTYGPIASLVRPLALATCVKATAPFLLPPYESYITSLQLSNPIGVSGPSLLISIALFDFSSSPSPLLGWLWNVHYIFCFHIIE